MKTQKSEVTQDAPVNRSAQKIDKRQHELLPFNNKSPFQSRISVNLIENYYHYHLEFDRFSIQPKTPSTACPTTI